jgi:hypothetical protein
VPSVDFTLSKCEHCSGWGLTGFSKWRADGTITEVGMENCRDCFLRYLDHYAKMEDYNLYDTDAAGEKSVD